MREKITLDFTFCRVSLASSSFYFFHHFPSGGRTHNPFLSSAGQIVQTVVLPLRHCAAEKKRLMSCYKGEGEFAWCGGHVSVYLVGGPRKGEVVSLAGCVGGWRGGIKGMFEIVHSEFVLSLTGVSCRGQSPLQKPIFVSSCLTCVKSMVKSFVDIPCFKSLLHT
jgi:hypothetical protein